MAGAAVLRPQPDIRQPESKARTNDQLRAIKVRRNGLGMRTIAEYTLSHRESYPSHRARLRPADPSSDKRRLPLAPVAQRRRSACHQWRKVKRMRLPCQSDDRRHHHLLVRESSFSRQIESSSQSPHNIQPCLIRCVERAGNCVVPDLDQNSERRAVIFHVGQLPDRNPPPAGRPLLLECGYEACESNLELRLEVGISPWRRLRSRKRCGRVAS